MVQDPHNSEVERLRRRLDRETRAREEAESLLESKSEELFQTLNRLRTETQRARDLGQAIEAARDGIAITDADGNFTYMNLAHAEMFGYQINEILAQPWSTLYDSAELVRFEQSIMPSFARTGYWHGETIGKSKHGKSIVQDVVLTGLPDGGLICATRDITTRRLQEIEARALETRLQQAEREAALFNIGNAVAHDFNNLLAVISGNAMILKMDIPEDSESFKRVGHIESAAEQAASVIRSLELERGNDTDTVSLINLVDLINTGLNIAGAIQPPDVRLDVSMPSMAMVKINEVLLSRCLLNIVKNAFEAVGGNGKISLRLADGSSPPIIGDTNMKRLGDSSKAAVWTLEITDTGPGISKEKLDRIFDPFFTTKTKIKGSGLGLMSLTSLVETGLARVEVESVIGVGTCFRLMFFEGSGKSNESLKDESVSSNISGCKTVDLMLVDDNPQVGEMLSEVIRRMNYEVLYFQSSTEALEEFKMGHIMPGAVITDLTMPDLTGDELARQIKLLDNSIPVIVYSGQAGFIKPAQSIDLVLQKPIAPNVLKDAISSVLDVQE